MGCSSSKAASEPVQAPTAASPAPASAKTDVAKKGTVTQGATKEQEQPAAIPLTTTTTTATPETTIQPQTTASEEAASSTDDAQPTDVLPLTDADPTLLLAAADPTLLLTGADPTLLLTGAPIETNADVVSAERLSVSFAVPESSTVVYALSAQTSSEEVRQEAEVQSGDNNPTTVEKSELAPVQEEKNKEPTAEASTHSKLDDVKERVEAIEGAVIDAVKVGAEHVSQGVSEGLEKTSNWLLPHSPAKAKNLSTKAKRNSSGLSRQSRSHSKSHDDLLVYNTPKRQNQRRKSTQSASRYAGSVTSGEQKPDVLMGPLAFLSAVFTPNKAPWWSAEADKERERDARRASASTEKVVGEVGATVDAYGDTSKVVGLEASSEGDAVASWGNAMADGKEEEHSAVVEL